jgi:hypothetical protein
MPNAELPSVEDPSMPPARPVFPNPRVEEERVRRAEEQARKIAEKERARQAEEERRRQAEEVVQFRDAQESMRTIEEQESLTASTAEIVSGHAPGSSAVSSEMMTQKPVSMRESRQWRGNRLALATAILALVLVVVVSVSYRLVVTQSGPGSSGGSTPGGVTTPGSGTATPNGSSSSPALSISPMTLTGSENADTNTCTGYIGYGVKWECKVTLQNTSSVGVNWSAKGPKGTNVAFPAGATGHLNPNEQHQLFIEFPYNACAQAPFALTIAVQNGPSYTVTWNCS